MPPFAAKPVLPPPCEPPPHAAVTTTAATAHVVFAFIAYLLILFNIIVVEGESAGLSGNQNKANCSPARAESTKSSTPVPLITVATESMNFASETTGTPNSQAR